MNLGFKPVILVILVIALIGVALIYKKLAEVTHFYCPQCHRKFKAKPMQLACTVHANTSHLLKCPYCGKRAFMKQERD